MFVFHNDIFPNNTFIQFNLFYNVSFYYLYYYYYFTLYDNGVAPEPPFKSPIL